MESRKNSTDEPTSKAQVETQTQRMKLWTQSGEQWVGQIETVVGIHYHVQSRQLLEVTGISVWHSHLEGVKWWGRAEGKFKRKGTDKESACQCLCPDIRDMGSIPGSGRCLGVENGNSLQYSCLENSMHRKAWLATVDRVPKSWTPLNVRKEGMTDFTLLYSRNQHNSVKQLSSNLKEKKDNTYNNRQSIYGKNKGHLSLHSVCIIHVSLHLKGSIYIPLNMTHLMSNTFYFKIMHFV